VNERDQGWRYSFVGTLLFVLPLLIIFRVVRIQINPEQLKTDFASQGWAYDRRTIVPARGQIYDRWGNLLAGNQKVYEVGVELRDVKSPETIAQTLSIVLGLDYGKALAAASTKFGPDAVYAVVADNVTQEQIDRKSVV
jgi:cell division protein FtsI/penicillin-binding protein 2